ncbi:putative disease resistance protein RGA1 [Chenopodium quinoa]|uniref:putative disease resistance protein RGA1 n=1 Tax=Chenopodium quinoa TaxID=63459 RepID=UPI000B788207|nr:putative disease resistance protein RGA1 [Chenopodium quinoa]
MRDIAQNVAGKEICFTNSVRDNMDRKVRHISHVRIEHYQCSFSKTHIRSFLDTGTLEDRVVIDKSFLKALVASWVCLRVLDLSKSGIQCLPHSIGELLHLRYIDISYNVLLDVLPQSITKLFNLQTLKLNICIFLKELPKDLMRLVNLRILDITDCNSLTNMPKGLSKLTYLRVLSKFVLDGSKASQKQWFDQLGELKRLNSLKGELFVQINFVENAIKVKEDIDTEGAYLRGKEHLKLIIINFDNMGIDEEGRRLMEELQPHPNLKGLELVSCVGMRMPSWARENKLATSLPNLNRLHLYDCGMEDLICLGNLRHLQLQHGTNTTLEISDCPNLKLILLCPNLEELNIKKFNERLQITVHITKLGDEKADVSGSSTGSTTFLSSSSSSNDVSKLRKVSIDDVLWLNSFPREVIHCLVELCIFHNFELESLKEAGGVFSSCSSSLRSLEIGYCYRKLRSVISGGLEHLSALEALSISSCPNNVVLKVMFLGSRVWCLRGEPLEKEMRWRERKGMELQRCHGYTYTQDLSIKLTKGEYIDLSSQTHKSNNKTELSNICGKDDEAKQLWYGSSTIILAIVMLTTICVPAVAQGVTAEFNKGFRALDCPCYPICLCK